MDSALNQVIKICGQFLILWSQKDEENDVPSIQLGHALVRIPVVRQGAPIRYL